MSERIQICRCRLELKCEWCKTTIKVGDEYEAHYDGKFRTHGYCRECVRKQFDKLEGKEYNLVERLEIQLSKSRSRH